ncbi:TIR domain-containing protein [Granulicella pectinivorans]|uniref:TIR domain-containing protein n=1 Tax=Granulicella pectinivorans TaxID=474950 RepID=A0A1I6MIL2_9BACT|nr:toll/interleukin-1 receptor domain-containing protein [Granulicella pectinivorans]SFS15447.1 TIR domain-containing protein [Granulicella pectinivorans]
MQESSTSAAEADPKRQLATLKFQKATAKLYEDLIRATHDASEKQKNEGIHSAASYARKTADALIARFQTIEELFEATYLSVFQPQFMSDRDYAWLREQGASVVDEQLKRVQGMVENLCSSFVGSSAQQHSKYLDAASGEAALMKARIESSITIHLLEQQQTVLPKPSRSEEHWDVFICHASEDKPYVETLFQKLTEAGIRVWLDRTAIDWGNDLRTTIDHGLKNCIYGIVVFSKAFLAKKKWTEYELSSLFALEEPGRTRILPIWHGITEAEMREYSPGFSLRLAKGTTRDSYQGIVESLKQLLNKTSTEGAEAPSATTQYPKREHIGPAAADAHYEMVGKAEPLVKFIVRTIIDGSGDYGLETWVGTPLELSATFRGTREEVALKFVIADKDMQLKGYSRRGHFVGDRAFSLS